MATKLKFHRKYTIFAPKMAFFHNILCFLAIFYEFFTHLLAIYGLQKWAFFGQLATFSPVFYDFSCQKYQFARFYGRLAIFSKPKSGHKNQKTRALVQDSCHFLVPKNMGIAKIDAIARSVMSRSRNTIGRVSTINPIAQTLYNQVSFM